MDDSKHARQHRELARELRQSNWWKQIRARGICHYCGEKVPPHRLTMDHVIPIASGGQSIKTNIVPSCKICNSEKSHRDPLEEAFAAAKRISDL